MDSEIVNEKSNPENLTVPPPSTRKRGKLLTVVLVISEIFIFVQLRSSINELMHIYTNTVQPDALPVWHTFYDLITSVAEFWALITIFQWKKYGIFLYVGLNILDFVVSIPILMGTSLFKEAGVELVVGSYVFVFVFIGITIFAVKRKWEYFRSVPFGR